MERVATQEPEFGSAGWISMCDVYLLFSALAIALCLAAGVVAQQLGLEKRDGDRMIASLQGKVDSLTAERDLLQREIVDSENAGEHVPALRNTIVTLEAKIAHLQSLAARSLASETALKQAQHEINEARLETERLREDLKAAGNQRAEAESARDGAVRELANLRITLQQRQAELAKVRAELVTARGTLAQAEQRATQLVQDERARQQHEGQIRQELLGLKGPLDRVVFLFDRSESMKKNDRWEDAKNTMRVWLEHLPVKEAAMVLFSSGVIAHPNDGTLLPIDDRNRQQFIEILSDVNPGGATNTLDAIKRAYQYPNVDAIILFTDGQPNPTRESSSGSSVRDVYDFIESQNASTPNTRIHAIGVGDYFSKSMRDFLLKVADMTDGSFLGR